MDSMNRFVLHLASECLTLLANMANEPKFNHHFAPISRQIAINICLYFLKTTAEDLELFEFDAKEFVSLAT
jgi:hypothetical protein